MDGIDISRWQKGIDLDAVAYDFVIMKATEGNGFTDPEFLRHAKATAGELRGFYHFARPDLNNSARAEANWFLEVVQPHLDGRSVLVLDWEAGALPYGPEWAKRWLDRVRKVTGIAPLLYTSTSVTRSYDWSSVARSYELWVAAYGKNQRTGYRKVRKPSVGHWDAPTIFQYGSKGRLSGYSGNLDVNRAWVDASGWRRLARKEKPVAGMTSPAQGRFTSGYGWRDLDIAPFHAGVDIANSVWTDVHASYAGTVKAVGTNIAPDRSGWQNILIENPDGEGNYYGHLEKALVKEGDWVEQGQHIGEMGDEGNVTGPHLHFEIWGDADDPGSHRDPMIDFNHWGVEIGSKPIVEGGGSPPPNEEENMATPKDTWKYRGFDYANPDRKTATTKDHQVSRAHQYILYTWRRIRDKEWRSWLATGIWRRRGIDYVNNTGDDAWQSTHEHQLSRAHQYSLQDLNETRALRTEVKGLRDAIEALSKGQGEKIEKAVVAALEEADKRVVQAQIDITVADRDEVTEDESADDVAETDALPEGEK